MRELPIYFAGLGIEGTRLNYTVTDPAHGNDFRIISARKNLVRGLEVVITESFLDYFHSAFAQQPDHPLTGNARQKCSIRYRCINRTTFCHKDVGSGQFGDVAKHVADNGIVKSAGMRLEKRAGVVWIETSGFGIHRHGVLRRPSKGRQGDREPGSGFAHRRLVYGQTPASRLKIMRLNPRPFLLRPIHRSDVKCGVLLESGYTFPSEFDPRFRRNRWFQEQLACRVIDPCAMELQIWCNAFERPGTVKNYGAKPSGVRARTHDGSVSLMPISLKTCPGFGPRAFDRHSCSPLRNVRGKH